jgi:hypothetical protein
MDIVERLKVSPYLAPQDVKDAIHEIERLREALKNIVEACEDVNSPDKKVREENLRNARAALKGDE